MDTVKESHKKFILKFELVIGRTCDRTIEKKGSQDKVSFRNIREQMYESGLICWVNCIDILLDGVT